MWCVNFKDEKFEYYGGSLKHPIFQGGDSRKTNTQGGGEGGEIT